MKRSQGAPSFRAGLGVPLAFALTGCSLLLGIGDLPTDSTVTTPDGGMQGASSGTPGSSSGTPAGSSSGSMQPSGDGSVSMFADGGHENDAEPGPDTGPVCGSTTCSNGCCGADGVCHVNGAATCGVHGIACTDCAAQSLVCSAAGQCGTTVVMCSATNCAGGCCSGTTCVTAITPTTCGPGGTACIDCTKSGDICASDGSECIAPPVDAGPPPDGGPAEDCSTSCSGCCDAQGVCQPGTASDACGTGGTCVSCVGTQTCQNLLGIGLYECQ